MKITNKIRTAKDNNWSEDFYDKTLIVIHATVSKETDGGAALVASWFNRPGFKASTQYVVDNKEVIQVVPEKAYAWAAGTTANKRGIHIELVAMPQQTRGEWNDEYSNDELELAAELVAELCAKYNIPVQKLAAADLRDGKHGICGHADVRDAWNETTHWDPGPGFPWAKFLNLVRHATLAAKPQPVRPVVLPRKKPVVKANDLSIVQANFLKTNKQADADIATLAKTKAHLIGLNEAKAFIAKLGKVDGYQLVKGGSGAALNNPVLVRDDVKVTLSRVVKMCDKVNQSPDRWATVVQYDFHGEKRAHIQTHANAHIEDGGEPRDLPRVKQDIVHMQRLQDLYTVLAGAEGGTKVTISGDLNWAWDREDKADWEWSPEEVFKRLGLTTTFEHKTNPAGGTLGSRDIDYVAYAADDLTVSSQKIVGPEHSDHRWVLAKFKTKG